MIFPENIGCQLSIDETSLSNGELYTILTNKAGKGKKGKIVAIVEGTGSKKIIEVIERISKNSREQVKEVTLDMAGSMNKIIINCFPKATKVIDRFHVQKWISMFKEGQELWALQRRTNFPPMSAAPASVYPGHNVGPFRYPYPSTEHELNSDNETEASAGIVDEFWGKQIFWDTRKGLH